MNTQEMHIKVAERIEDAPNYKTTKIDGHQVVPMEIRKALVVGRGTQEGRPTVDLQVNILDPETGAITGVGVIMTTGALIDSLAAVIKSTADRHAAEDQAGRN